MRLPEDKEEEGEDDEMLESVEREAISGHEAPADSSGLAVELGSNWDRSIAEFDEMNLRDDLIRGIYAYGFEKPNTIQQKGIEPIMTGRDTICQAQSGTTTYAIAILNQVDYSNRRPQALVLVPTRELALQCKRVIQELGRFLKAGVETTIGDTHVDDDIQNLRKGPHIIVGTPGHAFDLIQRGALEVQALKYVHSVAVPCCAVGGGTRGVVSGLALVAARANRVCV
jgi:superfamily II DNA/RNA helicase